MARSWSSKAEFSTLSGTLAESEEKDFEAKALPLVRLIWPGAVPTSPSRSFDRAGADHLCWGEGDDLELVVQAKGFRARTRHLGSSQISQCVDSIRSFKKCGLETRRYVLVHNRDGRYREFNSAVDEELQTLVAAGCAEEVEKLDRQSFLRRAFDATYDRLWQKLKSRSLSHVDVADVLGTPAFHPLEVVPVRDATLAVDQYRLRGTQSRRDVIADPAQLISAETAENLVVLIGGFGFGKTTTILRALSQFREVPLYVPGALIDSRVVGTKDFLMRSLALEEFFADFDDFDIPTLRKLVRPCVEYATIDPDSPLLFIIDGLDESAFLARRGGLQQLFNILRPVKVPVFLAMRTEFWRARNAEFETSVGTRDKEGHRRTQHVRLLELLPWTDNEITELVARAEDTESQTLRRNRLKELRLSVESGAFEKIYGDIPRRPLFLRQIVDSVAENGLPPDAVQRAQLMRDWAELKIRRDVLAPVRSGEQGRSPLTTSDESLESVIATVWAAMIRAAELMTLVSDDEIELLPSCDYQSLVSSSRRLENIVGPLALTLHSLLVPVSSAGVSGVRLRFAHRAYQEFFLAWAIAENPAGYQGVTVPSSVESWVGKISSFLLDSSRLRQTVTGSQSPSSGRPLRGTTTP